MLLAALATGLLVGLFQAATQINEQTLSFIPKLLAMVIALLASGSWLLAVILDYTRGADHRDRAARARGLMAPLVLDGATPRPARGELPVAVLPDRGAVLGAAGARRRRGAGAGTGRARARADRARAADPAAGAERRSAVGGGGADHRAGDRHRGGDGTRRARRVQRRDARRREHRGHDGTRLRADERSAERRLGADRQPVLPDPRDPPVRDPRRAPRGARARRVELHDAAGRHGARAGRDVAAARMGRDHVRRRPRHRAALARARC